MLRFFSKWLGLATLSLALFGSAALAEPRHGLSGFGDLKYPTDFKHFEYVNPDAPKGGTLSLIGPRRGIHSTASTISFSKATRRRAWNICSIRS